MKTIEKYLLYILISIGIVLSLLKLTRVITWSWWLVLIPFYSVTVLSIIFTILMVLIGVSLVKEKNMKVFHK